MLKSALLVKCGSSCICNSKVLFWCVWCAGRKSCFGVSGVLTGSPDLVCLVCWPEDLFWCVWCVSQKSCFGLSGVLAGSPVLVCLLCWPEVKKHDF